jgi:hypothetical protein
LNILLLLVVVVVREELALSAQVLAAAQVDY